MKLNISYSPEEEERVKRIAKIVATLFPTARSSYAQKKKYRHCYIETHKKIHRSG